MLRATTALFLLSAAANASDREMIPGFDAARAAFSRTGEMDLGSGKGDLDMARFEVRSVLCRPLSPADGLFILPFADYEFSVLDFDGAPTPFQDEELHSISLSSVFLSMSEGSPWLWGGWARAQLASDFQHVDGDDFTFDLAGGAAYRFNERFTLGLGVGVINLNGDAAVYPGIGFDWIVSDQLRVGLYGPSFIAEWAMDEDWLLTFRGDPGGGVWNVTGAAGESRSIDLTSYRLGLYASRRITGQLWLTAGGGMTVGNEIDYTTSGGREILGLDPETGFFGAIGLRLKAW